MKRIEGYHPSWQAQKAIEEFEEAIGQPIRTYLRKQAKKGHGARAIGDAIGISYRQVCSLLSHHGIKTTGSYRPIHKNGFSLRAYIRKIGGDRAMEDRVRARMKLGLSVVDAVMHAQKNSQGYKLTKSIGVPECRAAE